MNYILGILGGIVTLLFGLWRGAVSKANKAESKAEGLAAREGDAVLKHELDKLDKDLKNRPKLDDSKKSDEELAEYFNKKKK